MPILGIEPTQFISEGYLQHAFNYLGFRKKYADIGTRTYTVYFRRLLATRVQLTGLKKEICRYWNTNQHSLFPTASGYTRSTTWAAESNMPILGLEPTQVISESNWQHAFNYLGCRKKYAGFGIRTTQYTIQGYWQNAFNYLGCRKKYASIGNRTTQFISEGYWQHAFNYLGCRKKYPDIWNRNTQFISKCYWQHAFNYLGCRKKYADIGSRTNTFYFRRILATRVQLPGLEKEICQYWDSNQHALNSLGYRKIYADIGNRTKLDYLRRLLPTCLKQPGLQK